MFHFLRKRAKSEHQRVQGMLSAYIDGELCPEEQALVKAHLAECESCARNLRTLRRTVELLGELPAVHAPRSFAISQARPVERLGWAYTHLRSATALAAILLVIVLAGDVFLVGRAPAVAPAPAVMRGYKAEKGEGVPEMAKEKATPQLAEQERPLATKATPKPTSLPKVTGPQLERAGFSALRWAEIALFLSTLILALATIAVRRRRG